MRFRIEAEAADLAGNGTFLLGPVRVAERLEPREHPSMHGGQVAHVVCRVAKLNWRERSLLPVAEAQVSPEIGAS